MSFKSALMIAAVAFAASVGGASAQDAAAGEGVFTKKCKVCHQIGETAKNGVGPKLNGLIGRKSGEVEGYNYSDGNKASGLTWDEATFKEYITNPKAKIPTTKMIFAGLPSEQERNDLFAYLKQFNAEGKK